MNIKSTAIGKSVTDTQDSRNELSLNYVCAVMLFVTAAVSMPVMAKTYNYSVTIADDFTETFERRIGGKKTKCSGKTCKWQSSDSSPSVAGCKKRARSLGKRILSYGHEDRKLSSGQLRECNSVLANDRESREPVGRYTYKASFYTTFPSKFHKNGEYSLECKVGGVTCKWRSGTKTPTVKQCKAVRKLVDKRVVSFGNRHKSLSESELEKCNRTGKYKYVMKFNGKFERSRDLLSNGILSTCIAGANECFWYSNDKTPSVEGCGNKKYAKKYTQNSKWDVVYYGIVNGGPSLNPDQLAKCNRKLGPFNETRGYLKCRDNMRGHGDIGKTHDIGIRGHDWHCYEAKRRNTSNGYVYHGKLSHVLTLRPDDTFKYSLKVRYPHDPEKCESFVEYVELKRGGLASHVGTVGRWVGKDWEDKWRDAARDWDSTLWEEIGYSLVNDLVKDKSCKN